MFKVLWFLLVLATQKALTTNFICSSGGSIEPGKICDGKADCVDESDERPELCSPIICDKDQFKCYNGACIDRPKFCDNSSDCTDGSDEFNCGKLQGSCE